MQCEVDGDPPANSRSCGSHANRPTANASVASSSRSDASRRSNGLQRFDSEASPSTRTLAFGGVPVSAAAMILAILFLSPQAAPTPTRCDGAEYHQFDFWIGDWE